MYKVHSQLNALIFIVASLSCLMSAGCTKTYRLDNQVPHEQAAFLLARLSGLGINAINGEEKDFWTLNVEIEMPPGKHDVELFCRREYIDYVYSKTYYSDPYLLAFEAEPGHKYRLTSDSSREKRECYIYLHDSTADNVLLQKVALRMKNLRVEERGPVFFREEDGDRYEEDYYW